MVNKQKMNTLMKKIIKYFLIIIVAMSLLNAYSSLRYKAFYTSVYEMLQKLVDMYSITQQVDNLYQNIDNYSNSGMVKYSEDFDSGYEKLLSLIEKVKESSEGEEYYEITDLKNMASSFYDSGKEIGFDYNNKIEPVYIKESLMEFKRLKENINNQAKNILLRQLSPIMYYYAGFWEEIAKLERLIYFMIILIALGCIFIAYRFTREISDPIHQLVLRLQKVAKGQLDVGKINIKTNDEINVLIESFNFMTLKIKDQIEEIKNKASIEKELKEQQIKNLEMANLLNQSELQFLQSQINPHFLYNTMNTISALATIENADQTKKMIESLSDILKYNLMKINENVTLMEEYKIIEDYIHIQKARFGTRIEYKLEYDESIMEYNVPSMILQPFVENAIIHGLEPKEEKGLLELTINDENDKIIIIINDNGLGMEKEKLESILSTKNEKLQTSKRGIGVSNVIRRLEIKYGKKVVEIKSEPNKGTKVILRLPKKDLEVGYGKMG